MEDEQLPEVREAVVLHRQGASGEGKLEAHVVTAGQALSEAELRTRLGTRLPHYLVPARVVFHESLPRLASDKVDRKALALSAPATDVEDAERDFVAPRKELMAQPWADSKRERARKAEIELNEKLGWGKGKEPAAPVVAGEPEGAP